MGLDIAAVRDGIDDSLDLDDFEVQPIRDNPIAPGCLVYPKTPFPLVSVFEGATSEPRIAILVIVPYVDTDDSQDQLDALLNLNDDDSFISQLFAATTLNGAVASFDITDIATYGITTFVDGGTRYLSAELLAEVKQ